MADLTRGYNVPGVYVRDATGPLVTNAAGPDAVVTLVGPAVGFQTSTDAVAISTTPQDLRYRGVWLTDGAGTPEDVFVPIVRKPQGNPLVAGTDYVLTTVYDDNGTSAPHGITRIARGAFTHDADGAPTAVVEDRVQTANGVTADDTTFLVTYAFTSAAYFTPLLFDSYDAIVATYGQPCRSTTTLAPGQKAVLSPLSLAAALAFLNGATSVICVATDPTPVGSPTPEVPSFDAQLRAAYEKTLGDPRVGTVIPLLHDGGAGSLDTLTQYGVDLRNHVLASTDDGYPRIGILGGQAHNVGASAGLFPAFEEVAQDIAAQPGGSRVVLAFPNRLSYYNSATNRPIEVDGFYLAAALGGVLSSNPVQQSLTRETVVGFTGLPASITRLTTKPFKDNLSSKGVLVVEVDRQNRLVVRHGVSTDVTNAITREVSVTRSRDALFDALQIGLDSGGLIGSAIDSEMTTRLKGAVAGILEGLVRDTVILGYTDLKVRQQSLLQGGDPTVIEVRFAYQPTLPLNYIVVTFSLDLTTGNLSLGDNQSSLPAAVTSGL